MLDEMLKNYSERGHKYGTYSKITMEKWQFHQVCREILGLMDRLNRLEAENADLRNELRDALERC